MYISRRLESESTIDINFNNNKERFQECDALVMGQTLTTLTWLERARRDNARYHNFFLDEDFCPVAKRSSFVGLEAFGSETCEKIDDTEDFKVLSLALKKRKAEKFSEIEKKKEEKMMRDSMLKVDVREMSKEESDKPVLDDLLGHGVDFNYSLEMSDSSSTFVYPDFKDGYRFEDEVGLDVIVRAVSGVFLATSEYSTTMIFRQEEKDQDLIIQGGYIARANLVWTKSGAILSFFDMINCGGQDVTFQPYDFRYYMLNNWIKDVTFQSKGVKVRIKVMENRFDSRPIDMTKFNWLISKHFKKDRYSNGILFFSFISSYVRVELISVDGTLMVESAIPDRRRKLIIVGDFYLEPGYYVGFMDDCHLIVMFSRVAVYRKTRFKLSVSGFRELKKGMDADFFSALVERSVFENADRRRDLFIREYLRADYYRTLYDEKKRKFDFLRPKRLLMNHPLVGKIELEEFQGLRA